LRAATLEGAATAKLEATMAAILLFCVVREAGSVCKYDRGGAHLEGIR
jgi:hypothetical protein